MRLVDGRLRAHRPNASFSAILADSQARFKPSSRGVWGAAAPQENVRTQLTEPPKTKRLVDGRACAHRPNAIDKRTKNWKSDVKYWTVRLLIGNGVSEDLAHLRLSSFFHEVEMDVKMRSKWTPNRGRNGRPSRSSTILFFNFCGRRRPAGPWFCKIL